MAVANISAADLKARGLARRWGVTLTTAATCPVAPCPRPSCGGSLLAMGDGSRCLLCARADDDATEESLATEAALGELMETTPGPVRSLRATPADEADRLLEP